jgi:hypothetical protein
MRSLFLLSMVLVFVAAFSTASALEMETPLAQYALEGGGYYQFSGEPGKSFHEARHSFLAGETRIAADDIRKGANFLRLEAGRATGEGKKALMASVNELEQLAKRVEKGSVTTAGELDETFGRAHQALARHHYLKAAEYWSKKETANTGHALNAAADNLKVAAAWTGRKAEESALKVADDARAVSEKLIQGKEWASKEVTQAMEGMGKEIEKLRGEQAEKR